MSYFPESLMPSRLKDESQDVKGNAFVVSAADHNKHDEEIRAIEKFLGPRRAYFPGEGFSGAAICGTSSFSGYAGGYSAPSGCSSANNAYQALANICAQLARIRDSYAWLASGIVACANASMPIAGPPGKIDFPTDWPTTQLAEVISDPSTDDETVLPDIASVALVDVSGMPTTGYVSIINDLSMAHNTSGSPAANFPVLTSLVSPSTYAVDDTALAGFTMMGCNSNGCRDVGSYTNVEILFYSGLDVGSNKILNVRRKQLGTTSTRHVPSDLVFKGRLSMSVAPVLFRSADGKLLSQVECYLRSDGTIKARVMTGDAGTTLAESTAQAYAQYQAVLLGTLDEIPPFEPGKECA